MSPSIDAGGIHLENGTHIDRTIDHTNALCGAISVMVLAIRIGLTQREEYRKNV
jgi:hypothetical protein